MTSFSAASVWVLAFPEVPAACYFAFYWGYDVQASARGSVALAPGAAVTFGAQGAQNDGRSSGNPCGQAAGCPSLACPLGRE